MTDFNPVYLLKAAVYASIGVAVFYAAFLILGRLAPYDIWKEIVEKQNVALAILVGAMSIGMCLIIAAAVH